MNSGFCTCSSPTSFVHGKCLICGKVSNEPLVSVDKTISIKRSFMIEEQKKLEKDLIDKKLLALSVDLDGTLIHSCEIRTEEEADQIIKQSGADEDDFIKYNSGVSIYLIRIRPYARQFLESLKGKYYMYPYTKAMTDYAKVVVNKLDPNSEFFHGKLIASVNYEDRDRNKNIDEVFPCIRRLCLVLDDQKGVWIGDYDLPYPGLVKLNSFRYFLKKDGEPNVGENHDETLNDISAFLLKVHANFFDDEFNNNDDINSRNVLYSYQKAKNDVFDGKILYLAKCWKSPAKKENYIRKMEGFGALIVDKFYDYITHIVVGTDLSLDDYEVLKTAQEYDGICIVKKEWVKLSRGHFAPLLEDKFECTGEYPLFTEGQKQRGEMPEPQGSLEISDNFFNDE